MLDERTLGQRWFNLCSGLHSLQYLSPTSGDHISLTATAGASTVSPPGSSDDDDDDDDDDGAGRYELRPTLGNVAATCAMLLGAEAAPSSSSGGRDSGGFRKLQDFADWWNEHARDASRMGGLDSQQGAEAAGLAGKIVYRVPGLVVEREHLSSHRAPHGEEMLYREHATLRLYSHAAPAAAEHESGDGSLFALSGKIRLTLEDARGISAVFHVPREQSWLGPAQDAHLSALRVGGAAAFAAAATDDDDGCDEDSDSKEDAPSRLTKRAHRGGADAATMDTSAAAAANVQWVVAAALLRGQMLDQPLSTGGSAHEAAAAAVAEDALLRALAGRLHGGGGSDSGPALVRLLPLAAASGGSGGGGGGGGGGVRELCALLLRELGSAEEWRGNGRAQLRLAAELHRADRSAAARLLLGAAADTDTNPTPTNAGDDDDDDASAGESGGAGGGTQHGRSVGDAHGPSPTEQAFTREESALAEVSEALCQLPVLHAALQVLECRRSGGGVAAAAYVAATATTPLELTWGDKLSLLLFAVRATGGGMPTASWEAWPSPAAPVVSGPSPRLGNSDHPAESVGGDPLDWSGARPGAKPSCNPYELR
jgi:hypothetical protein